MTLQVCKTITDSHLESKQSEIRHKKTFLGQLNKVSIIGIAIRRILTGLVRWLTNIKLSRNSVLDIQLL